MNGFVFAGNRAFVLSRVHVCAKARKRAFGHQDKHENQNARL
jgi:hypothetical protein